MITRLAIALLLAAAPSKLLGQTTQLQLVRELGVEDGPEEYSFGKVGGIALTSRQEILILDSQAKLVRRFDLEGKYLGNFGREGAGPGEFQLPRLHVVKDAIWVSDARLQRLTIFTLDGELVRTVSAPSELGVVDVAFPLRDALWLGQKTVSNFSSRHIKEIMAVPAGQQSSVFRLWRAENASRLVLSRPQSTVLDTIASWDPGSIPWFAEDGSSFGFLATSWGALGGWAIGGDSLLAHVSSVDGSVRIWLARHGRIALVKTGRLPIAPQRITESELSRLADQERKRVGKRVRLIPPPAKGQLASPIISNKGDIWILQFVRNPTDEPVVDPRSYLVVPIDGRRQHYVTLPSGFTLYAVVNDLLLGKRETENEVDIVQVWRLPHLSR